VITMCVRCEGGSEEDLLTDEFVRIALDGFVMVAVEPEPPWAYTIGLTPDALPRLCQASLDAERASGEA
jgi:hypothetical protein